jgi:ribosomal protein L11 methyltransferase
MSSTRSAPDPIRTYIEVEINASQELLGELAGVLSQLGFEGFWEDGETLRTYMRKERWSDAALDEVRRLVNLMVPSNSTPRPQIRTRALLDQNWNEQWERTIQPIAVTDRVIIKPTWQNYTAAPDQIVLTIDPKMSFGTGYHESTRLSLRLLEKYSQQGTTLLDIGTGTGILAIAGIKLGAAHAAAVDIDEWAYNNALENCALNGVESRVEVLLGGLQNLPERTFDLIVANIQRSILESMLGEIRSRMNEGSILILSGLITADRTPILEFLRQHALAAEDEREENGWIAIAAHPIRSPGLHATHPPQ